MKSIDDQIAVLQKSRASLADEFRQLQDGRQQWLANFISNDPHYIPLDNGIMARMMALSLRIGARSELLGFTLLIKFMIMALEAAGPLTKILLTTPGVYAARVVLRLYEELDKFKRSRDDTQYENDKKRYEQENNQHQYAAQRHAQDEVQELWRENFHKRSAE